MPSLPESEIYLLVRTYFGDDPAWDALRAEVDEGSEEGFFANVEYVDDRQFEGFSSEALEAAHPHRSDGWDVMYVADAQAITHPAHPLLLVRVGSTEDLPFRCRADRLYEVDANLSLANLDWDDFRYQVDESGVYGGIEVVTAPEGQRATDPAVAAHNSTSADPVTITVPPKLWFEIHEDLYEAPMFATGTGYREVGTIATQITEQIMDGDAVVPRMRPEDDVVVTLPAKDWAFIRERARQLQLMYGNEDDDGRQRGIVGGQIINLISRHIR